MPFAPGQSGNPEGARIHKQKRFFNALDRAIEQDDSKKLRAAAEKLLELAEAGEPWAVQMLADRLDGKAAQQVQVTGEDGGAVQTDLTVRFVGSEVKP